MLLLPWTWWAATLSLLLDLLYQNVLRWMNWEKWVSRLENVEMKLQLFRCLPWPTQWSPWSRSWWRRPMPPSGKPPALVLKLRSSVPAQYVILKSFSSWNRRDLLGWLLLLCLRHHHHHCIYSLDNWLVQVIGNLANLCPLLQNIFLRLGGKDISDLDKKPMPQPSYRQTTDKSETSRESGNSETSTAAAAN